MSVKSIGILGGGQLGRMSALAAAELGIKIITYSPDDNGPASQVSAKHINASYNDESALRAFADEVDVITYEFENVPLHCASFLEQIKPVYPKKNALEISQNRIREKTWLNQNDIATAKWKPVKTPYDITQTMTILHFDNAVLKTVEQGYDGKGQAMIHSKDHINEAWDSIDHSFGTIIEERVDFDYELSVIVARGQNDDVGCYTPSLNIHEDHILKQTRVPAPLSQHILNEAISIATDIANKIELVGVMGIEFFLLPSGKLLVNEIAPRPHNSGHWTIDACYSSQFEQHIRAVAGLPLGSFDHHHNAEMTNLLGDEVNHLDNYYKDPSCKIHLYGKETVKTGRKMGHVTKLFRFND